MIFMKEEFARIIGWKRNKEGLKRETVQEIAVELIVPNPYQPREAFDEEAIRELSQSIMEHGVIQPVLVRPAGEKYELVIGERRWRACQAAGFKTIPAIVRSLSPKEAAEMALVENLQRKNLNPIEEATGYQRLLDEFGLTQQELAKRVGKDQSTIANKLRLLRLPKEIQDAISREIVTERHGRALLRLPSAEEQIRMAERIREEGLTVSAVEALVEERLDAIRRQGERGPQARKRMVRALKDIRIFLNSIREVVQELKATGTEVELDEREGEGWLELQIRIRVGKERP